MTRIGGILVLMTAAACGDDGSSATCGPGSATDDGLTATGSGLALAYGDLTAGQNNDCPAADAPTGVISLTIRGMQTGRSGAGITLCVPRPDLLAKGSLALGPDAASSGVRLVDLGGGSNGCTLAIDPTTPPTGTVTARGLCGDGSNAAGFALTLAGAGALTQTCAGVQTIVDVTLAGTAAVTPAQ